MRVNQVFETEDGKVTLKPHFTRSSGHTNDKELTHITIMAGRSTFKLSGRYLPELIEMMKSLTHGNNTK